MENTSQSEHFANQVGGQTLALLKSYRQYGVLSRTFMLKDHDKNLEQIRSKSDHFQDYEEDTLNFLEARTYVELIERTCQVIEDFCIICFGLSKDLSLFSKNISRSPNPPNVLNLLTSLDVWNTLMRYPTVQDLQVSEADRRFLRSHYERNIEIFTNLASKLQKFWNLYGLFYNKIKHGNSLIYGLRSFEVGGDLVFMVPYVYNSKQPENIRGIPVSYNMNAKLQVLFSTVVQTILDLIDRAIMYIEYDGMPILELATYYATSAEDKSRLQTLVDNYVKPLTRTNVIVQLDTTVDMSVLQPFLGFYENFSLDFTES